ncbi:MAG: WXG100 family type VII secretion target, partial [Jatrophihabitantaceae bacterium]
MASEQSFGEKIWGTIIDPGGDPEDIHRAAGACRKLGLDLSDVLTALDPIAVGLAADWHGDASDGFQHTWGKFMPAMNNYTKQLHDAAKSLDNVADAVHEAQIQARNFKIMVVTTLAAGAAMTLFTFGTSDAAAIVAIDAEAGVMATMLARLGALLAGEAEAVSALISAMQVTLTRFAIGVGFSLAATLGVKHFLQHQDVLDPANYTAKDATNLLLGGVLTAGMGSIASMGKVSALLDAHPILGAGGAGVIGGTTGATINQTWLNHASLLDPSTLGKIGLTAVVAGVSGMVVGAGALGITKGIGALRGPSAPLLEEPIGVSADSEPAAALGPNGRPLSLAGTEEPPPPVGPPVRPNGQPLFPPTAFPRPGFKAVTPG